MHQWIPLTSGLKEPAESWISGRKRSLRYDVRLISPQTIDVDLPSGEPGHSRSPNEGLEGGCATPRLSSRRRLITYYYRGTQKSDANLENAYVGVTFAVRPSIWHTIAPINATVAPLTIHEKTKKRQSQIVMPCRVPRYIWGKKKKEGIPQNLSRRVTRAVSRACRHTIAQNESITNGVLIQEQISMKEKKKCLR